jgi:hypothetical protein
MDDVVVSQLLKMLAAFGLDEDGQRRVLQLALAEVKPKAAIDLVALSDMTEGVQEAFLSGQGRDLLNDAFVHFFPGSTPAKLDPWMVIYSIMAAVKKLKAQK